MESISDRLRIARENAGFTISADAPRALGVSYPTYAAHENGSRGIPGCALTLYARRFRVVESECLQLWQRPVLPSLTPYNLSELGGV